MTTYNIAAPEAGYNGNVGKVKFHNGKATIDDEKNPAELRYCQAAGYLVEEADDAPKADATESGEVLERPAANAPKDAWLRYAVQLGATPEQVDLTKAQLIEWVDEHEGEDK